MKEFTRNELGLLHGGLDALRHEYYEAYLDCKKYGDTEGVAEYWGYIKEIEKIHEKLRSNETINVNSLLYKHGL